MKPVSKRVAKYKERIMDDIEKHYINGKKTLKAIAHKYKIKEFQVQQLATKVVYEIMDRNKLQKQISEMTPRTNEGHGE